MAFYIGLAIDPAHVLISSTSPLSRTSCRCSRCRLARRRNCCSSVRPPPYRTYRPTGAAPPVRSRRVAGAPLTNRCTPSRTRDTWRLRSWRSWPVTVIRSMWNRRPGKLIIMYDRHLQLFILIKMLLQYLFATGVTDFFFNLFIEGNKNDKSLIHCLWQLLKYW